MSGFNALNAKIAVLRRGLFNSEDYEKILSFEKREDLVGYIKENPILSPVLANYRKLLNMKTVFQSENILLLQGRQSWKMRTVFPNLMGQVNPFFLL